MPSIFIPSNEKFANITRPVAMGMVRQILKMCNLPENMKIIYNDMLETAIQPGSALGDNPDKTVPWLNDSKVSMEVEEAYFEERLSSNIIHRPEHRFIFQDDDLEVYVKPVYSTTRVRVTLHCAASHRNLATRWRDELKQRITDGRDAHLFQATYSYEFPVAMQNAIEIIHKYREKIAGYGEDLATYFKRYADPRITILTNQVGGGGQMVVPETQGQIVGLFDFTVPERGNRDEGDAQRFSIELPFTFMYEQPIGCLMSFPHYVHQQWMNEFNESKNDLADAPLHNAQNRSLMSNYLSYFEAGQSTYKNRRVQGFSIPWNDDFRPESVIPSSMRIFTVLASITPEDRRTLFNLTDPMLDGHVFDPKVLAFIKSEWMWLAKPFKSLFNVSLYQKRKLAHYTAVEVDENLNVYATEDLDLRLPIHVRFSILTDWSLLSDEAKDRMTENGDAIVQIVSGFEPPITPPTPIDGYLPGRDIDDINDQLNPLGGSGADMHLKTVETFYIRTYLENK